MTDQPPSAGLRRGPPPRAAASSKPTAATRWPTRSRVLRRRWAVLAACVLGVRARRAPRCTRAATTPTRRRRRWRFNVANLSNTALGVNTQLGRPGARRGDQRPDRHAPTRSPSAVRQAAQDGRQTPTPGAQRRQRSSGAERRRRSTSPPRRRRRSRGRRRRQRVRPAVHRLRGQGPDRGHRPGRDDAAGPAGDGRPRARPARLPISSSLQRLAQLRAVANGDAQIISRAGPGEPDGRRA